MEEEGGGMGKVRLMEEAKREREGMLDMEEPRELIVGRRKGRKAEGEGRTGVDDDRLVLLRLHERSKSLDAVDNAEADPKVG
jgi:hypothetical protein